MLDPKNRKEDFGQYRDLFGSPIQKEAEGSDGPKAEIDLLLKKIDRKLKRFTQSDSELIGQPDYQVSPRELIPISLFDNEDDYNALGGSSSKKMMEDLEKIEQEKTFRLNRYRRLLKTLEAPEAEGILMVYADEATSEDQDGDILHILHPDKRIKETITDLFQRCNIYDRAWSIVYNMSGFGDDFYDVIPALSGDRIAKMEWLPRDQIERVELNNVLQGFKAIDNSLETSDQNAFSTYKYVNQDVNDDKQKTEEGLIHPFRILHFRIPSDKYMPYGKSVLDAIVSPVEQLNLMIKSMLIARVTRAPERRIFHIDVGNLQGEVAIKYAYDAVNFLKRKKQLDSARGETTPDVIRDAFGATEDIVIPKRAGTEGNSIDTLPSANGLDQIGDIEFLNNRIFPSTGVPREYLYDSQFALVNSNLSSKSVIFAKRVRRIQRFFLSQLYKLVAIELKLRGFSNEQINDVTLMMNNPSNIDDKEKIEIDTEMWSLISTIKGSNTEGIFYPDYLIYKKYLKLDDEEIVELLKLAQLQAAGENIFKFLPEDERPEGAKDLVGSPEGENAGGEGGGGAMGGGVSFGGGAEEGMGDIPPEAEEALGEAPAEEGVVDSINPNTAKQILYVEATEKKLALIKKFQEAQAIIISEIQETSNKNFYKKQTVLRNINLSYLEETGELDGLETIMSNETDTFLEESEEK